MTLSKEDVWKKMYVSVTIRAFTQTGEQPGLRDRSGVTTQRPQRGRALFDNKLKSTARADGARCQLSFHQGSRGGRVVIQWVELGGVMRTLRCCSLSCGHSPCAGISCSFLPRNIPSGSCSRETSWNTHTHTRKRQNNTWNKTGMLSGYVTVPVPILTHHISRIHTGTRVRG